MTVSNALIALVHSKTRIIVSLCDIYLVMSVSSPNIVPVTNDAKNKLLFPSNAYVKRLVGKPADLKTDKTVITYKV